MPADAGLHKVISCFTEILYNTDEILRKGGNSYKLYNRGDVVVIYLQGYDYFL